LLGGFQNKIQIIKNKVFEQVKQIMEEAVTRKFVHEESSSITSFCGKKQIQTSSTQYIISILYLKNISHNFLYEYIIKIFIFIKSSESFELISSKY
jgi:hypothetical protein